MQQNRLMATATARGGLEARTGLDEALLVHGRYRVVCLSPRENERAEYVAKRDAMLDAEARGDFLAAEVLARELDAFELNEAWHDEFDNLVTTVGKNDFLDKYLKGSTYTQTVRMGLCGTGTKAAGDTQASHGGWLEVGLANAPVYTGNRPSITFGSASSGQSVAPQQSFAITSSGTVAGCFINNGGSATKDDTTGILFSAGDFTGGSRAVINGDTLKVDYTLSV